MAEEFMDYSIQAMRDEQMVPGRPSWARDRGS